MTSQNPEPQLFYFEGALARHFGSLSRCRGLKTAAGSDTFETNGLTGASISFKANPIWVSLFAGLNLFFEEVAGSVQWGDVMRPPLEGANHRNNQKDERREAEHV